MFDLDKVKDTVTEKAEEVGEKAEKVFKEGKDKVEDLAETAKEKIGGLLGKK